MSIARFFYINLLSGLHNDDNIIFCKTDYLLQEFNKIKNLDHDVILISGNSDYSVTSPIFDLMPRNIVKWYAQNALCKSNNIIEPIPLGLVNGNNCYRADHGVSYSPIYLSVINAIRQIQSNNFEPYKNIYANFNVYTNLVYRSNIKSLCQQAKHIDWEEPTLSLEEFFAKIYDYKMIICPLGNGFDTHRLWEVLYLGRVPVVIKPKNIAEDCYEAHGLTKHLNIQYIQNQNQEYLIYDLYKKLPIVILDRPEDLLNADLIFGKYEEILSNSFDSSILDAAYWTTHIQNSYERLLT